MTQDTSQADAPHGTSCITIPAPALLAAAMPLRRVKNTLGLRLTQHTYLPKVDSPRSDWVASVTLPAFLAYRDRHRLGTQDIGAFCTIGTGVGLDALAAIEALAPVSLTVTDLHQDVVDQAVRNIEANLIDRQSVRITGVVGNLALPLLDRGPAFDLIYENLPNIPLPDGLDLFSGQHSSSFFRSVPAGSPAQVAQDLLELHFALLCQARGLLKKNGRVLCSIGCRRPVASILDMPRHAGCDANILLYTWKIQSEAREVVCGYAEHQRRGLGPFHFYRIEALERVFATLPPAATAKHAFDIECELRSAAVDAAEAVQMLSEGVTLGHTVAVLEATPRAHKIGPTA